MRGYESPCGVMSDCTDEPEFLWLVLRIPMRGYESVTKEVYALDAASYESPCGVMSLPRFG